MIAITSLVAENGTALADTVPDNPIHATSAAKLVFIA
jgi:hypothetical protein